MVGVVAFDLDGTLLRGPTVCELLAEPLGRLAEMRVPSGRAAAVGDSGSDAELLSAASLRFFVGTGSPPALAKIEHRPAGDITSIAREVLDRWAT